MGNFYTYLLIDPRNNLPFYVGKGQRSRCYFHMTEARTTDKISPKLQKIRKIESLGLSVVVQKIERNVSDEMAKEFECFAISEMRDFGIKLTNLTDGGDGRTGYKASQGTIAKLQLPCSEEKKKRISESLKGRSNPCTEKRRQAIIAGTTGIKKSTTINMKKPKRKEQCPHCGTMASGGNLAKWHLNNCKQKEITNVV